MVELKSPAEIERMHTTGRFVAGVLSELGELAEVGFGGVAAVEARGIDLGVAVRLEEVEEGGGRGEGVHAGLFDAWRGVGQRWCRRDEGFEVRA